MQTSKVISTISYNTEGFLSNLLPALVNNGLIDWCHWIKHEAEEDEKKAHYHLILRPSKRLDTNALQTFFMELVPAQKPLKCLPFVISKTIKDWVLYSAHDKAYLIQKGESRKYQYDLSDFKSTDEDLLFEHWREAHSGDDTKLNLFFKLVDEGVSFEQIVRMGFIPANAYFMYRDIFQNTAKTYRNGRPGHD